MKENGEINTIQFIEKNSQIAWGALQTLKELATDDKLVSKLNNMQNELQEMTGTKINMLGYSIFSDGKQRVSS